MKKNLYLKAFTLAEILVTLVIIGIVASLTIPVIINIVNNYVNYVRLRKTYTTFQQAYDLIKAGDDNNIISIFQNDTTTNFGNGNALNSFLTKMTYIKNCGTGMGCLYNAPRYYLNGSMVNPNFDVEMNGTREKAILIDGSMVMLAVASTTCTANYGSGPLQNSVCANLWIDVNGAKNPNIVGRDLFRFNIAKTGIYPTGNYGDGYSCNVSPGDGLNSQGCAFKVISEGGINY